MQVSQQKQRWMIGIALSMVLGAVLGLQPVLADVAEPAGFVLMATGDVYAIQTNQQLRKLQRKSPFFPGETLKTDGKAKAQVRFRDGSLISLRPATEIRIDEFRFNEGHKGEDKNIFTLVTGGFRTITGKIGKKNPDSYQMKSAVASIGVRGTHYEAVMAGGLNVAAWQGTVVVENEGGSMTLGAEGVYNFATVSSASRAPRGMMKPPGVISNNQEIKSDDSESGGDGGNDEQNAEEQQADEQQDSEEGTLAQDMENGSDGEAGTDSITEAFAGDDSGNEPDSGGVAETEVITVYEDIFGPINSVADAPTDIVPEVNITFADYLQGVALDRLAMTVRAGSGFSGMLAGGKAGYDASGMLNIADNTFHPGETGFNTAPYAIILSQNAAANGSGYPQQFVIDSAHTVEFGVWQASATTPGLLYTDASDISVYSEITQPIFWGTAKPTLSMPGTGIAHYRNVLGFIGGGSGGAISNIYMDLGVNFGTGAATGQVHVYNGTNYWDITLAGSVMGPVLDFTSFSGTVNNGPAVNGEFNSLFTGGTAQAIVSSFDFEATGNPALHVEGLVLVDDTYQQDVRITDAIKSTINRRGVIAKADGMSGTSIIIGGATTGLDPIFAFNGYLPGDMNYSLVPFFEVVSRNGVTEYSAPISHGVYPVTWGIWDAGNLWQLSYVDPGDQITMSDPLLWMTVVPTTDAVMSSITGVGRYYSSGYFGTSEINSMYWHTSSLVVDFDSGQFAGNLFVDIDMLSNGLWDVSYFGNIAGSHLNVTSSSGKYTGTADTGLTNINSSIDLTFTGSTGDAIAGMFNLELNSNPAVFAQGAFVAERDLRLDFVEAASLDRIGLIASNSWSTQVTQAGLDSGASAPIFGLNYEAFGTEKFKTSLFSYVFRQETAVQLDLGTYAVAANSAFQVDWGRWDGTSTPYVVQNSYTNSTSKNYYYDNLYWMTLVPTPDTAISSLISSNTVITYNSPISILGGGSTSTVIPGSFTFTATLDYGTGNLTAGNMNFLEGGLSWDANFVGNLANGAKVDVTSITGLHGGTDSISGNMGLMLTGSNAQAMGGNFRLWTISGTAADVEGVFLVCQAAGGC